MTTSTLRILRFTIVLLATVMIQPPIQLSAQQLQVTNGQLSTQAAGDLAQTLSDLQRSAAPVWVAYVFPTDQPMTTASGQTGVVHLESREAGHDYRGGEYNQKSDQALLLVRLAGGAVSSLRLTQPSDRIDAGGLRFVELTGVTPEQSIAALKSIALTAPGTRQRKDAVFFISLHRSAAAVPALAALAGPGQQPEIREAAAFWLANQRGHDGFLAVRALDRQDADPAFRRKLAFDLTLSHDPEALPELIRMAHQDTDPGVRQQAQFWMAQEAGKLARQDSKKIAAELRASADNDPDAESRKQAVFAVSRLPAGEATPQLADLVRTSKYPEVREQAVFWLGQSHDPAALDVITSILQQPANQSR